MKFAIPLLLLIPSTTLAQEQPIQRVQVQDSIQSRTNVDIEHIPAQDIEQGIKVQVIEQPRPAPKIIIYRSGQAPQVQQQVQPVPQQPACQYPRCLPPQGYVQPQQYVQQQPVQYVQQQPVVQNGQVCMTPSEWQQLSRFYFGTHYRRGFRLFAFMPPRYVPRRADSIPMQMWDQYWNSRMARIQPVPQPMVMRRY